MDLRISGSIDALESPSIFNGNNHPSYNNGNGTNRQHNTRHQHSASLDYSAYDELCSVCLTSGSCDALLLPCSHTFHSGCILQWVNTNNNKHFDCPNCRTPIQQFIPIDVDSSSSDNNSDHESYHNKRIYRVRSNSLHRRRRVKQHRRKSLTQFIPICDDNDTIQQNLPLSLTKSFSVNDLYKHKSNRNEYPSPDAPQQSKVLRQSTDSMVQSKAAHTPTIPQQSSSNTADREYTGEFAVMQRYDDTPSYNTPSSTQLREWFNQQINADKQQLRQSTQHSIASTSVSMSPEPTIDFAHLLSQQLQYSDTHHNTTQNELLKNFLDAWNNHYIKRNHSTLSIGSHSDQSSDHTDTLIKSTPLSYIDTEQLQSNVDNHQLNSTEQVLTDLLNLFDQSSIAALSRLDSDELVNVTNRLPLQIIPPWRATAALLRNNNNVSNVPHSSIRRSSTDTALSTRAAQRSTTASPIPATSTSASSSAIQHNDTHSQARNELNEFLLFAHKWARRTQQNELSRYVPRIRIRSTNPATTTLHLSHNNDHASPITTAVHTAIDLIHQHSHESHSTSEMNDQLIRPSIPVGAMLDHHHHFLSGLFAGTVAAATMAVVQPSTGLSAASQTRLALRSTIPAVALYFSTFEYVKLLLGVHDNIDNRHGLAYTSAAYGTAAMTGGLTASIFNYITAGGGYRRCIVSPLRFGTQFAVFEQVKLHWAQAKSKQANDSNTDNHCGCVQLTLPEVMAAAAAGGIVAGTLTYPLHHWSAAADTNNNINTTNEQHHTNTNSNHTHSAPTQQPNLSTRIGTGFTAAVRSGYAVTLARFMPTCVLTAVSYELGCRLMHNAAGHDCQDDDDHHSQQDHTQHHLAHVHPPPRSTASPMQSNQLWLQRFGMDLQSIIKRQQHNHHNTTNQFINPVSSEPAENHHFVFHTL